MHPGFLVFKYMSSFGSTEQVKTEVLTLFGKGARSCNQLCKDVVPLEQIYVRRYKLQHQDFKGIFK